MQSDTTEPWKDRQLAGLTEEIAERLRSVCAHMAAEDFRQLVEEMARVQRKWEEREAYCFLREGPSPRAQQEPQ